MRAMCGVQLKDRRTSLDVVLMLGFNGTMDLFVVTSSVRWYGHVRSEGVLRRTLEVEVKERKQAENDMEKAG